MNLTQRREGNQGFPISANIDCWVSTLALSYLGDVKLESLTYVFRQSSDQLTTCLAPGQLSPCQRMPRRGMDGLPGNT